MGEISIIQEPARIDALFAQANSEDFPNWNHHPLYGNFARAMNGAINDAQKRHQLCHFAVVDGSEALILVPATCDGETISMFGTPLVLGLRRELGKKRRKKAFAAAFTELKNIATGYNAGQVRILGSDSNGPLGPVDFACTDQGARPQSHIHGIIDTSLDEQAIHRQLRDSYRSLVNWGRAQLHPAYINAQNPSRREFDLYTDFHAKVAGESKYTDAYWDTFWNQISAGRGEMSLGYLDDGRLATGTLVIDAGTICYYTSGVYERELFDKPLAHFPVFDSIIRAGQRGMLTYDLGEIFATGAASEKEVQIGFFKKGFTSDFRLRTVWVVEPAGHSPAS